MKAIITLTKGGANLGYRLLKNLDKTVLYVNPKFIIKEDNIYPIEEKVSDFVSHIFHEYECLIFIMATGIVVRSIAPHIKDKKIDPAVLVLDEKGRNVISLLSGHIGGANEYTKNIAKILGANPVITTASDVNDSIAVDTLSIMIGGEIESFYDATKVTAHIVNKEKVGITSDIPIKIPLPENIVFIQNDIEDCKGIIYVTNKEKIESNSIDQVIIRLKNIILGVGCRRGKSKEEILNAIEDSLIKLNISQKSIKHIATVDLKKDEKGLIEAAKELKIPLVIIDREEIKKVQDQFKTSEFVKKITGVGAVCEPVAYLSSKGGNFIQNKKAYDGITIAVFEEGDNNGDRSSRCKS
ncbi:cobalt-precorrin 5A hydrolase [Inediibacterium massiliense]|uniref:cobalt-precorrin 5A hydrolase n=1 Tax=Inediibacterium massiliense TaxID=1658111 RepID=UPI0006B5252B|nr:cobalt-precorrin 5A hydrolase [Inediibacterium massiliense]